MRFLTLGDWARCNYPLDAAESGKASLNCILAVVDAELWDVGTEAAAVTQKVAATPAKASQATAIKVRLLAVFPFMLER